MPVLTKCQMYDICRKIHGMCNQKSILYEVECEYCDFFKMYCKGWNDAVKAIKEEDKNG